MSRIKFFKSIFGMIGALFGVETLRAGQPKEDCEEIMIQAILPGGEWPHETYYIGKAKVRKIQDWWYDAEFTEGPTESLCKIAPKKEDKSKWI